jgi:chromosome segregation ATPase
MNKELGTISAKLNAHQQSLNALQAVQSDHTKRLTRIEDRLTGVEGRLGNVETDLATVKTGVHAVLDLLDTNLAKKSLADRLAGRLLRLRDDGAD